VSPRSDPAPRTFGINKVPAPELPHPAESHGERTFLPNCFAPYEVPPGFGVIACYFNPNRYRSKLRNYRLFRESLRVSGIPSLTIECLFPGRESDLHGAGVSTVIARDTMWQKERLLNLAIDRLPTTWTTVAWLDCDVLFENRNWAVEAVEQLQHHAVVQLFSEVVRLPLGESWGRLGEERWDGFAAIAKTNPNQLLRGNFTLHGHTGFAWAAHRDLLTRHRLYDGCITGSGDHMMAHAFAGDWTGDCIARILGGNHAHRAHFGAWAQGVYGSVRARMSYVPGTIFHLWHGNRADREYDLRNREFSYFNFNPGVDLRIGDSGCWEWASDDPILRAWGEDYFSSRREDGDACAESADSQGLQPTQSVPEAR
jgi:hypothetical protein